MVATPTAVPSKPSVRRTALIRESVPLSAANARTGEDRYRMIAEAAYFRAESRGFAPGRELQDWLAAEVEVDEILGDTSPG